VKREREQKVLPKQQVKFLSSMIDGWRDQGIVNTATADLLSASYTAAQFNWRRLSGMAIIASVSCFFVAVGSVLFDEVIIQSIKQLFGDFETALFVLFSVSAVVFYVAGFSCRHFRPTNRFTNEGFLALGVLGTAAALFSMGNTVEFGSVEASYLLMIGSSIYIVLGLVGRSELIWVFALIAASIYFGIETHTRAGEDGLIMGLGYPARFALYGTFLVVLSLTFPKKPNGDDLSTVTFPLGLAILFVSLWLMSMFGNSGELVNFFGTQQTAHLQWTGLLAFIAVVAIWWGLRFDNEVAHVQGIFFLLLNIYTRYFEFFWDSANKAIFFAVLGASLWIIGIKAQRIWNMGRTKTAAEVIEDGNVRLNRQTP
jgi:uncharacterized membrane protein